MKVTSPSRDSFRIDLSKDELRIIWGCITEALELGEGEFHARVGADKEEVHEFRRLFREAYGSAA